MGQPRRYLDFAKKARNAHRSRERRVQHLDCHIPVVPDVVSEVNGCHAARAKRALNAVSIGQSPPESDRLEVASTGHRVK
jgi:hypothetical protein